MNGDKVKYWVSKGASVSDTVHNLLVTEGILETKKKLNHNLPEKKEGEPTVAPKTEVMPKVTIEKSE